MDPHRPIPHPPPTAQDQLPSDEHSEFSDFPPIRVRNSTPNPPDTQSVISRSRDRSSAVQNYSERRSSPSQSPGPRLPRHSHRLPSKPVLGRKNIVNTVEVTVHVGHHAFPRMVLLINECSPERSQVLVQASLGISRQR